MLALAVAFSAGAIVVGCGDDDNATSTTPDGGGSDAAGNDGGNNEGGGGVEVGTVTGTANYSGTETGPLYIVAATEFPPAGPPAQIVRIENPTYPQAYEMKVGAGEYHIAAYISTGGDHGTGPRAGDPTNGVPPKSTVTAGETITVDITLTDPPPKDAGPDADDDAGDGGNDD